MRFESRVFVATLEISERRETNLEGSRVSEGGGSTSCDFQAYKEKGIILERIRVSDVLITVVNSRCA